VVRFSSNLQDSTPWTKKLVTVLKYENDPIQEIEMKKIVAFTAVAALLFAAQAIAQNCPSCSGQSVYATPSYGQTMYSAPSYSAPVYNAPVYNAPMYNQSMYSAPAMTSYAPMYSQPVYSSPVMSGCNSCGNMGYTTPVTYSQPMIQSYSSGCSSCGGSVPMGYGTPVYMNGQMMDGGTIISAPMEGQMMEVPGTPVNGAVVEPQSTGEQIQGSNAAPEVEVPPAPTPDEDSSNGNT
jgi:hypothetical protein